jgi:hypothetical protein
MDVSWNEQSKKIMIGGSAPFVNQRTDHPFVIILMGSGCAFVEAKGVITIVPGG